MELRNQVSALSVQGEGVLTGPVCLLIESEAVTARWMARAVTEAYPEVEVIIATSRREAGLCLTQLQTTPHRLWLVFVDLSLSDGSGLCLIHRLTAEFPLAMSVVASAQDDDTHLFEAISAGAQGYLLKDLSPEIFITYLKRIEQGEPPLSPSIARRLLAYFHQKPKITALHVPLTSRETETLTLLARGMTINEIARHLNLKGQTVASYVKTIYQKLNVSSRAEATLAAVHRGLA